LEAKVGSDSTTSAKGADEYTFQKMTEKNDDEDEKKNRSDGGATEDHILRYL